MQARVEQEDGTYKEMEMGNPICGEDFCDGCGDCLDCQVHSSEDWCGGSSWVIYLSNEKNPNYKP